MGIKKGRIYGKGAPFKGAQQRFGGSCPKLPPGSATACISKQMGRRGG